MVKIKVSDLARFTSVRVTEGQYGTACVWIMGCKTRDLVSWCWFIAFVYFRLYFASGKKKIIDPWWESGQSLKWVQKLWGASRLEGSRAHPWLGLLRSGANRQGQCFFRRTTTGKNRIRVFAGQVGRAVRSAAIPFKGDSGLIRIKWMQFNSSGSESSRRNA